MGVAFRDTCAGERADKTASSTADDSPRHCTRDRGHQPPSCHDWSNTRNGQETEARQETADTANRGTDTSALPGILGGLSRSILPVSVVNVI
ncbi:MAG: hypothetical protein JOY71_29680 [Acetobacteraceae bacterium]|nr:hypothetical protein [Acetobacteraceae bacterium]